MNVRRSVVIPVRRLRSRVAAVGRGGDTGFRSEVLLLAIVIAVMSMAVRATLLEHHSDDYERYLKPWLATIREYGGYRALRHDFADYNVPYLYILVALSYLPNPLVGIKLVSISFDIVLAFFTFRIVALRYSSPVVPAFGALLVLLLPTVCLNSAMWGQCDSIYAAFGVAALYYLIRRRPWLGCALMGISYAFKQQAVFLFPVLLVLALRRTLPWRALLAVPAAYLVLDVPAALLGRPVGDLLTIYVSQAAQYPYLTAGAPTVYQFIEPTTINDQVRRTGVLLAGAVILLLVLVMVAARVRTTPGTVLILAVTSAVLVPFVLPGMHERYFYLADVLSVAAALWLPRRLWYLPVLVQAASFLSYVPFLFVIFPIPEHRNVDGRILSVLVVVALLAVAAELRRRLDLSGPLTLRSAPDLAGDHPESGRSTRRVA